MLAASALQWACVDHAQTETAAAHARDSALTHDLVLAGYDSAAIFPAGHDSAPSSRVPPMVAPGSMRASATSSRTVTESAGDLASGDSGAPGASSARDALASSTTAESYIGPSCVSPALDDQQRCLKDYLAHSDLQLDRSYQALITRLKAEAGARGTAEPPVVQRLRTAQRNWLVYRDDECRKRTGASEGPLWAPVRGRCLAEYSTLRERELDDALAQRKPPVARSSSATPKTTKHTAHSKRARSKRHGRR